MADEYQFLDVPFPYGGENEDRGKADQDPLTARGSVNMRAKDPQTGEKRGAQRAGWQKYLNGTASAKVEWIGQQGYQVPLIQHTQLNPPTEEKSILTPSKAEAFSAATDRNGNVYVLDGNDTIQVYNSELRSIGRIVLPLRETDKIARKIVVDDRDNVYAGAAFARGDFGGRVWCYEKQEERWTQAWEASVGGAVVDLAYGFGTLYAAQILDDDAGTRSLATAFDTTGNAPVELWTRAMPHPLRGIAADSAGDMIATSPPNDTRNLGVDAVAFQEPQIAWVPYDLTNGRERIHFWLDAVTLSGFSSGDRVRSWPDARFGPPWIVDFAPAYDDTDRFIFRKDVPDSDVGDIVGGLTDEGPLKWLRSPRYDPLAFGPQPGVRFVGDEEKLEEAQRFGNVLATRANRASQNKAFDATGILPDNLSPVPGVQGARWGMFIVARVTIRDRRSTLFSHGGQFNFQLLVNAGSAGGLANDLAGNIVLRSTSTTAPPGQDTTAAFDWGATTDTQTLVISVVHNGTGNPMTFRVNGRDADVVTPWTEDRCFDPNGQQATGLFGATTRTGNRVPADPPDRAAATGAIETSDPLYGAIGEVITIFGDSSVPNLPHDTALTADEIARMEGYMAWRWGIQGNLPGAHPYASAPPPLGSFSGATFLSEEQEALLSLDGITAKYRAASGALLWAIDGFGMGLACATDESGGVFTYGPGDPDVGATDPSPTLRKVLDEGTRVEQGRSATGDLFFAAQPNNGDQVTIGARTYTFLTVLGTSQFEVAIGATVTDSRNNLVDAINLTGTPGTTYPAQHITAHYQVQAIRTPNFSPPPLDSPDRMTVISVVRGTTENAIVTTETTGGVRLNWTSGGTLSGGLAEGTWTLTAPRGEQSPDPNDSLEAVSGAGAWKVDTDENDDVYVTRTRLATAPPDSVLAGLYKYAGTGNTDGTPIERWRYDTAYVSQFSGEHYTSFAFAPKKPEYNPDTVTGPEFLFLTTEGPEGSANFTTTFSTKNLHKLLLVSSARTGATSPRGVRKLRVVSGNLETFTKNGAYLPVTNGAGAFDTAPREIVAAELYGKRYMSDGLRAKVYDALGNELEDWVAEQGEVPKRITHLASWRARIVCVSADDPFNYTMSRSGDALDFDEWPDVVTFEQPISGNNPASLGKIPDVITGLIPMNDQNLAFMCDHTIHLLTGDPLAVAVGDWGKSYIQLVSDITGMARGSPAWCKDPNGVVYFLGSRGGLYRWAFGTLPVEISGSRIRRQLEGIDFARYRVGLAWNYRERSVYIFQLPWGLETEIVRSWCWESDTGRWQDGTQGSFWPDEFGRFEIQPTALAVFDGDEPDDRDMLIGCVDGAIRFWDDQATSDDGTAIYSRMPMGPYAFGRPGYDTAIVGTTVTLGENTGSARVELYASQEPIRPEVTYAVGDLGPGRNGVFLDRATGRYLWVVFENGTVSERWSHERTTLRLYEMGLSRVY